ncbi:hypothetical protein THAR02_11043 [Trichoderma harzianum]|uniref:Uncharacterized protein n=1 Tax=Trichoderma harzianum TaxID=5544 RepID=A0A0F9Z8B7_TRIHA|nr:hypothetical protein THAR02_11043 [Trichoderma harzianum]
MAASLCLAPSPFPSPTSNFTTLHHSTAQITQRHHQPIAAAFALVFPYSPTPSLTCPLPFALCSLLFALCTPSLVRIPAADLDSLSLFFQPGQHPACGFPPAAIESQWPDLVSFSPQLPPPISLVNNSSTGDARLFDFNVAQQQLRPYIKNSLRDDTDESVRPGRSGQRRRGQGQRRGRGRTQAQGQRQMTSGSAGNPINLDDDDDDEYDFEIEGSGQFVYEGESEEDEEDQGTSSNPIRLLEN